MEDTQTEQTNVTNPQDWLSQEAEQVNSNTFDGETLPALKLETGKITRFTVDFSNPFNKWTHSDGTVKKIIPVTHKEERKNLWLNVKNPLYGQIITRGKEGQTEFAVSTTGSQAETRYTIVEEE